MAVYVLKHGSIGKTTHADGTAGAHVRYITRPQACSVVMAQHIPQGRHAARYWLDTQARKDRRNARICDKLILALPKELHPLQRQALLRRFMAELTGGLVPWFAAIHDRGVDSHNPHAHIVIRDRHIQTGRRHLNLSEKGSTKRLHTVWKSILDETLIHYDHPPTPKSQNKARGMASNAKTIQSYQPTLKTHPRATQGGINAYSSQAHL